MIAVEQPELLRCINNILSEAAADGRPDEITLRHSLNEGWFSDALAWLLDPRGDHGLGVRFLKGFVKIVAQERCRAHCDYSRQRSHFRWAKAPGQGTRVTNLRLANAAVLREFYLAGGVSSTGRGDRYCDVVVLDLDTSDGLILVIENKLFGSNSSGQLRDQIEAVEDKYDRAAVREYVYLTLDGVRPTSNQEDEKQILPHWVALGWMTHVLNLLEEIQPNPQSRLEELIVLLRWFRSLNYLAVSNAAPVSRFVNTILQGGVACLLAELNRLSGRGDWNQTTFGARRLQIVHSSAPKRSLAIMLLSNCSIAIESRFRNQARCAKLLLPFGAPAQQVFNLMHITARDLYWIHFDKPQIYLGNKRRRLQLNELELAFKPLLDFVYRHRFELQALLGISGSIGRQKVDDPVEAQAEHPVFSPENC